MSSDVITQQNKNSSEVFLTNDEATTIQEQEMQFTH
jgi:hypothetical protein